VAVGERREPTEIHERKGAVYSHAFILTEPYASSSTQPRLISCFPTDNRVVILAAQAWSHDIEHTLSKRVRPNPSVNSSCSRTAMNANSSSCSR
jgi:hypothetical protein